jgi:hypothetical protein
MQNVVMESVQVQDTVTAMPAAVPTTVPSTSKRITEKHYKLMTFAYWFIDELEKKQIVTDRNDLYTMLKFFGTNEEIIQFYDEFEDSKKIEEFKQFQRAKKGGKKQSKKRVIVHTNEEAVPVVVMVPTEEATVAETDTIVVVEQVPEPATVPTATVPEPEPATVVPAATIVESESKDKKIKKPRVKVCKKPVEASETTTATTATTMTVESVVENIVVTALIPQPKKTVKAKKTKAVEKDTDAVAAADPAPAVLPVQENDKKERAVTATNAFISTIPPMETTTTTTEPSTVKKTKKAGKSRSKSTPIVVETNEVEIEEAKNGGNQTPILSQVEEVEPIVEPVIEDDDDDIVTTEVIIDGILYLMDDDKNLYDINTHDFIRQLEVEEE